MEKVCYAMWVVAQIIVEHHLIRSRRYLQRFVWPDVVGETDASKGAKLGINTERSGWIWASRQPKSLYNIMELWAANDGILAPTDGLPTPLAFIQSFPHNGSTAYWFHHNDRGIEGPNYGKTASEMSRSLSACMDIVERKLIGC
jgi:hypothetical protein